MYVWFTPCQDEEFPVPSLAHLARVSTRTHSAPGSSIAHYIRHSCDLFTATISGATKVVLHLEADLATDASRSEGGIPKYS